MRCCALDVGALGDPAQVDAGQVDAMARAYAAGDRAAARDIALALLEQSPGARDPLSVLFNILRDEGKLTAAGAVIDRLARVHRNDAMARLIATQHFIVHREWPTANLHARLLVQLAPEATIAHVTMGRVFMGLNRPHAAEHHFRIAARLPEPRSAEEAAELDLSIATALREQGRFDDARAIFVRLGAGTPGLAVLLAWASLEEAAQRFEAADGILDRAATIAPHAPAVALGRANVLRRRRQHEDALATLDAAEAARGEGDTHALQRGQLLDAMGRYDEAFAAFSAFKQRQRDAGQVYAAAQAEAQVAQLRDFFTPGRAALLPRASVRADSPQPIFVVGFPRSGTTLVEQILSAHGQIAAGDELPIVINLTNRLQTLLGSPAGYPTALGELWLGDRLSHVDMLRDLYLNEAAGMGALDPAKRWFTDKMPLNETHLGLIALLFPQSPIVHLVRHPLDVVLSVFSNGLTHGFNCASSLESAARHYALIADLIDHYRAAMPLRYHAVRYEELVDDQERVVRDLFDAIGETFDPAVLSFHENPRPARTASYAQVTEKLYTRSRYRYRNYLRHLQPVMPILRPAIERLGYTIET